MNDRLDLLEEMAEISGDLTRDDIDEWAESIRDAVSAVSGTGGKVALLVVIAGSLLLAAVHIPNPRDMLRWPGLSLLLGGGLCLVVGLILNLVVPGAIGDAVAASSSGTPTALVGLAGDLVESFARQLTAGFIPAVAVVLVIGAVLFGASYFAGELWSIVRGALYGSGGNEQR